METVISEKTEAKNDYAFSLPQTFSEDLEVAKVNRNNMESAVNQQISTENNEDSQLRMS